MSTVHHAQFIKDTKINVPTTSSELFPLKFISVGDIYAILPLNDSNIILSVCFSLIYKAHLNNLNHMFIYGLVFRAIGTLT